MAIPPAPTHIGHVEQAARRTLAKWMWTYIGFAEQWYGYPVRSLPNVSGPFITASLNLVKWPEQRFPVMTLHGANLSGNPTNRGDAYDTMWLIRVGLAVGGSALSEEQALALARTYGAAAWALMCFQPLEGLPDGTGGVVTFAGWEDLLPSEINRRTMAGVALDFIVQTDNALVFDEIPTVPDPLPDPPDGGYPDYPDTPTAEQINVSVDQLDQEG